MTTTTYSAPDGTLLAYRAVGSGAPLVCLPGGPMRAAAYLGDLGGLSRHRRLILADARGTGDSAIPADPTSYRCDRQVDDVEALRDHLGLDRLDLLGHSAGASLALCYATRHPERVGRLALVTPSPAAVGVEVTPQLRRATTEGRRGEPYHATASAALERLIDGSAAPEDVAAIAPLQYGRWDAAAQTHHAAAAGQRNPEATGVFLATPFDTTAIRAAVTSHRGRVLVLAGDRDVSTPEPAVAQLAALFPQAEYAVQAGAGHYPWLDDPDAFTATLAAFLR
ncbi:alpha/beta hydrolase [Micromonospora sp. WMMD882]|uniref:alpha/beta fold hydrolase n=1 Tax=Micromonospora sp. WMMD882 TaxID=3015151 RepID=UPI00248CF416|nr:alpha/beta hydrolase [Micromonospora sp. WMMD882]WBB81794.1 alpha/beta hydrolase [Micromonospora sp. WMMD882]